MTEREKMLAGELYDYGDPELLTQRHKPKDLTRDYNQTDSADSAEKVRTYRLLLHFMVIMVTIFISGITAK